jgi:hypothetical protein
MYSKEREQINPCDSVWNILDPQGDQICQVFSEEEANGLLSHLNR